MAESWVRLWAGTTNDPKFRAIARKSGQPLSAVLAAFVHLMLVANEADDRGLVDGIDAELLAAAIDLDEASAQSILLAMEGRVLEQGRLSGWDKRQPVREDSGNRRTGAMSSTERSRKYRDATKRNADATNATDATQMQRDSLHAVASTSNDAFLAQMDAAIDAQAQGNTPTNPDDDPRSAAGAPNIDELQIIQHADFYENATDATQCNAAQRNATQCNAPDTESDTDTESEKISVNTHTAQNALFAEKSAVCDSPLAADPLAKPNAGQSPPKRTANRFEEFWAAYPRKVGRKPCEEKWRAKGLDAIAADLIADVQLRHGSDRKWRAGYIPNPQTYLAQERWRDEIEREAERSARRHPASTGGGEQWLAEESIKDGFDHLAGRRPKHDDAVIPLRGVLQ